ncbi:MAG: helix-hairpin-helix domain-containing protein [Phycisphaerae bacterium]|nr:helix-hairpin-helix domain-containing protein [Phycisphaerae bacterium]
MTTITTKPNRIRQRAIVIVMVLWIIVLLAILAVGLSQLTRIDNVIRKSHTDSISAHWHAKSAIAYAFSILAQDTNPTDSYNDNWHDKDQDFKNVKIGDGSFTLWSDLPNSSDTIIFGLTDESAKININVVTAQQLSLLPDMSEIEAQAIITWRDSLIPVSTDDNEKKPENLQPISTIRQLQWVPQLDNELLFGEDTNLNGLLDSNENDGDQTKPDDNKDSILQRGLLAYLTVHSYDLNQDSKGNQRININTADADILIDALQIDAMVADWIMQNRPYESIIDLLIKKEVTPEIPPAAAPSSSDPAPDPIPGAKPQRITREQFIEIADKITITDSETIPGLININTAPLAVLLTLPEITPAIADAIITARQNPEFSFTSIADLLEIDNVTPEKLAPLANLITTRSNIFKVHAQGSAKDKATLSYIEAIIDRQKNQTLYLNW